MPLKGGSALTAALPTIISIAPKKRESNSYFTKHLAGFK